jgi:hypothetical protein
MVNEEDNQNDVVRSVFDEFTASLEGESDVTPAARREATQLFEQALQDAASQSKTPEEVLVDWEKTTSTWSAYLEAMQKRGEISATGVADIVRQFDEVAKNLRAIRQRSQDASAQAADSPATPLPQGMPSDLARAFEQKLQRS